MRGRWSTALAAAGLRAEADLRNEKINYKVREHSLAHVPYLLVVGKREAEERTIALRPLGADARQEVLALDAVIARLTDEALPPDLRPMITRHRRGRSPGAPSPCRGPMWRWCWPAPISKRATMAGCARGRDGDRP